MQAQYTCAILQTQCRRTLMILERTEEKRYPPQAQPVLSLGFAHRYTNFQIEHRYLYGV